MNLSKSSSRSWSSTSLSRNRALSCARNTIRCAVGAALIALGGYAAARGLVPPGLYEIVVTQELPNVAKAGEPVKLQACLSNQLIGSGAAFHVRSENPLRECPISGLRANDDELIYRVSCPQPNSPSAKAKFVITKTGYEGAITIDMGGKNMTLTERHRARRVGECPEAKSPHVLRLDAQQMRERQRQVLPDPW
jgi:hypothetical protein